jgi:concentrative nucleoside transporter, CNT family
MTFGSVLHGLFGLIFLTTIAFVFSNNKRLVNWRLVLSGLALQFVFAILMLKGTELSVYFSPLGWPKLLFEWISIGFVTVLGFTTDGARFVFGNLANGPGQKDSIGFFFAF